MTKRTAKILGLILGLLWLLNLASTFAFGAEQELYPMTCFPMFKRPRQSVNRYHFQVVPEKGGEFLHLGASEMMAGSRATHSSTATYSLGSLCESLEKGHPLPAELRQLWNRNSQKYLALDSPPFQIVLIKTDYPLQGSLDDIKQRAKETVVVSIGAGHE